jgi:hypothetical protein
MKRMKGFIGIGYLIVVALFGALELEAVHDCANAAFVKSASCK